jgi:hypothetical protein
LARNPGDLPAENTSYERPDSLRGNFPPMKSLYVLRTSTRGGALDVVLRDVAVFCLAGLTCCLPS